MEIGVALPLRYVVVFSIIGRYRLKLLSSQRLCFEFIGISIGAENQNSL